MAEYRGPMVGFPHPFAAIAPWVFSREHGVIYGWSGSILQIPDGYVLCNGSNGTPDLRDKFIVGAGHDFAVNDSGGSTTHSHTFTSDSHDHDILTGGTDVSSGTGFEEDTTSEVAEGTALAATSMPAFYALAFLMKL